MTLVMPFDHPDASLVPLCGGKGANLSILCRSGLPVPPGFVVTARAYREYLAGARGLDAMAAALDFGDPARLAAQAEAICAMLAAVPVPGQVEREVRESLGRFPAGAAFAVRSSSTLEDMAASAFAGQHDTFLNCHDADTVVDRVRECWISLWRHRAVAYRRRSGFDVAEASMAVVVQAMVFPDAAGVGFSVNPVSGRLDEMMVDANHGLGESVVGGEAEVDHLVLDKKTFAVKEANIGRKDRKVVAAAGGGTEEVGIDGAEAERACLDDAKLRGVAALLVQVEELFRFPQDIEWAVRGDELFLLQSRPVTSIPPRWTRDESAERFPTVVTPLTWDLVEDGFHRSLDHSFRLMGFPPFKGKWFGMHDHYVYGNQNAVELFLRRSPLEIRSLDDLRAQIPRIRDRFRWVQELPVRWSTDLDRYLLGIGALAAERLDGCDAAAAWDFVMRVNRTGADYFLPNIAISITQSLLHRVLFQLLALVAGRDEGAALYDGLMAHCETKTGTINRELYELAALARATGADAPLSERTPSRELLDRGALSTFPEFGQAFERFLSDHGHREVDFDAYHPTWRDAPWLVLDNVRLILDSPPEVPPETRQHEQRLRAHLAERALFGKLPEEFHYFFLELVRLCRVYTALDDLEHYQTTRLTLPLRKGLATLGAILAGQGLLDEPMDVFFARRESLEQAIAETDPAARAAFADSVRREKADYLRHREREPEWTLGESPDAAADGGETLSGLPGSPGEATGAIHPVTSPEDFGTFPPGAVLLARTTNPTWTPLFYSACAVITESGGPLSHGAVTAREMRIPAVMSVRGCMGKLVKGQRVRVDGTRGRVHLIPPEE
jgi:pyruvate,water dikinase